jgi:tRNA 2-selenouridine synthase
MKVLEGKTSVGKTEVLKELKNQGQKVIDLEELASHKGSAFGNIGLPTQPSQEMFENMLAVELDDRSKITDDIYLSTDQGKKPGDTWQMTGGRGKSNNEKEELDSTQLLSSVGCQLSSSIINGREEEPESARPPSSPIWLEDESQRIGLVNIPIPLWKTIRRKPVYFLNIDTEERLNHIMNGYGKGDREKLISAIVRIQKRLGGLETKNAINFLIENNVRECFRILLQYYDKQYFKGLDNRPADADIITTIKCGEVCSEKNAQYLLDIVKEKE